ncbi:MAG: hypothetical protein IH987_06310 [Planctomycetes bacterium]|nr:hypothetical protein [Planctomycetota bacterium]
MLASLVLTAEIAGCRPEEAAGHDKLTSGVQTVAAPPGRTEQKSLRAPKTSTKRARRSLPSYELPFEARANPFEPPDAGVHVSQTDTTAVRFADVKLLGLMNNGTGPMAAVEVYGRRRVVLPGTKLGSPDSIAGLYIREIHGAEIVVEQAGRRWIVPLPRPKAIRSERSVPTAQRSPNAKGSPAINGR